MISSQVQSALAATGCEVRFDNLTRQLYATDASIYQVVPLGIAFPRNAAETRAVIRAAADAGQSVIPRGAGTGLTGGAIGDGLVLDFSRHNRSISDLDLGRRTVRVDAGVVLDQLNAFLKPHGFCFGPDVATSSRATLGGMIANDSSGARAPLYGTTRDHVLTLEIVLADGRIETVGAGCDGLRGKREQLAALVRRHAADIAKWMPPGLSKHWSGYGLARFLHDPTDLTSLLCGSEGTLAAIVSAELKIVPLPKRKGLALVFFASLDEAMQAAAELLDLQPAAIEHLDRMLLDQTRGQALFRPARDLLELDAKPCESVLAVEFFDEIEDRFAALEAKRLGLRIRLLRATEEQEMVWTLRKSGLSLLTSCRGRAKPVEGIEDAAVRPAQLPEYVRAMQGILGRHGLRASFYGHAASGLLHIRPVLDLRDPAFLRTYREVVAEVSAIVRELRGSFAAEHGLGMARTEFLGEHVGPELLDVMRQIKASFDPGNIFNPGKIVAARMVPGGAESGLPPGQGPGFSPVVTQAHAVGGSRAVAANEGKHAYRIDTHLRWMPGRELNLPFSPVLAFASRDGSFLANLEQCNGCGACRKQTPTMCPTFMVTGEESMSTRGRANTIRAVLELRGLNGADPLRSVELEAALSNCLSCRACVTECPSNVNLPLLKAELLHARQQRDGLPLLARLLSHLDLLGRLGCAVPRLSNAALEWPWLRRWLAGMLGITTSRPLPRYTRERFDRWFAKRARSVAPQSDPERDSSADECTPALSSSSPERGQLELAQPKGRGLVLLWDDCFTRYHEPQIGRAAVAVLEAAGFEVSLLPGRKCCGRPAFSQGNLNEAARLGRHNLALLEGRAGVGHGPPGFLQKLVEGEHWQARAVTPSGSWMPAQVAQAGTLHFPDGETPILFLEPSCYSMFVEDYCELKLAGADRVAKRCFLFEQFIEELLAREPGALRFKPQPGPVVIHMHCHAKSLLTQTPLERLARRLPGRQVSLLDTGCCGMAGAFGALKDKYELSVRVAEPLVAQLKHLPADTTVIASGTSCRQQIEHLTAHQPKHMAELLAEVLAC
jgi:FAD/FMN-containing dehydrogenase/Fe-S oxidoreductase